MADLVVKPQHSLLTQSLDSRLNLRRDGSIWATNGDGCGVGWYEHLEEPGLYRSISPAWNNINLGEITSQVKTSLFFSHIRAVTVGGIQITNCHPFKHSTWLFQHNGTVDHFADIKRELQFDIHPELFPHIKGTTDSETIFYLAMTYGLEDDPHEAMRKTVQRLHKSYDDNSLDGHIQLSCALTNGEEIYTLRYSNTDQTKTQYYSTGARAIMDLNGECSHLPEESAIIVSEPLDNLGKETSWHPIPDHSFVTATPGKVEIQEFKIS